MILKYFLAGLSAGLVWVKLAAADPIEDQWRFAVCRSVLHVKREEALKIIENATALTQRWFESQKISFRRIRLAGAEYDSFLLATSGSHFLNQQAAKVTRALAVGLVYSPGDLMRGSAGFYSEKDHVLGISTDMVVRKELDSTFYHEVIHAAHDHSRRNGGADPLSAVFQVVSADPQAMIAQVRGGYARYQTLEELEAHVESLVRLDQELTRLKGSKKSVEETLNRIYQTANEGEQLSRQSRQAIALALNSPSWSESTNGSVREIYFDASVYEIGARYRKIPQGAKVSWKLITPIPDSELRSLLGRADGLAETLISEFQSVKKSMHYVIEHVDESRTDLAKVETAVARLRLVFEAWKRANSQVIIPKF